MSLRLSLAVAALLALSIGAGLIHRDGYDRGVAAEKAALAADNARRLRDATRANDDALRCAGDPACRLRSDGFRRD